MIKLGQLSSDLPWLTVVGVTRDQDLTFNAFPENGPDSTSRVYVSLPPTDKSQAAAKNFREAVATLVIRPDAHAHGVPNAIARALRLTLPPGSSIKVQPWTAEYETALRTQQLLSVTFMVLGAVSLALGAAGLFSVISYVANLRRREFAVRIALGATGESVLRLVLGEGLLMALGGTAVGAALGMWAGFLLWNKMWNTYPIDVGALIVAETILLAVTVIACIAPAIHARRVDPALVLRAG